MPIFVWYGAILCQWHGYFSCHVASQSTFAPSRTQRGILRTPSKKSIANAAAEVSARLWSRTHRHSKRDGFTKREGSAVDCHSSFDRQLAVRRRREIRRRHCAAKSDAALAKTDDYGLT